MSAHCRSHDHEPKEAGTNARYRKALWAALTTGRTLAEIERASDDDTHLNIDLPKMWPSSDRTDAGRRLSVSL